MRHYIDLLSTIMLTLLGSNHALVDERKHCVKLSQTDIIGNRIVILVTFTLFCYAVFDKGELIPLF